MNKFPRLTDSLAKAFAMLVTEFPEEEITVEEYILALLAKKRSLRQTMIHPRRWRATGESVIRPPRYFWKYKTIDPLK